MKNSAGAQGEPQNVRARGGSSGKLLNGKPGNYGMQTEVRLLREMCGS